MLGAGSANDDGQVVRRARSGTEAAQFFVEELLHRCGVEDRFGFLVQERLVG